MAAHRPAARGGSDSRFALFVVPVGLTLGIDRAADLRVAGGRHRAARHRPGPALLDRQADGRSCCICPCRRSRRCTRQVVHRHRRLAARRRPGRRDDPASPASLGQMGSRAGDVGQPGAARRVAVRRVGARSGMCVQNLQDSIQNYRLDAERASTTGASIVSATGPAGDSSWTARTRPRCSTRCSMLGAGSYHATHPAVRGLLQHPIARSAAPRRSACWTKVADTAAHEPPVEKAALRPGPARADPGAALRRASRADRPARSHRGSSATSPTSRSAPRWSRFLSQPGAAREHRRGALAAGSHAGGRRAGDAAARRRGCWSCCPTSSRIRSGAVLDSGVDRAGALRDPRRWATCASASWWARVIERLGDPALVSDCAEAAARASATAVVGHAARRPDRSGDRARRRAARCRP